MTTNTTLEAIKSQGADVEAGIQSSVALSGGAKRKVAYFYHPDVGNFHYGPTHPMKPHRMAVTDAIVRAYGLYEHMDGYIPHIATVGEIQYYHDPDYVNFLNSVSSAQAEGRRVHNLQEGQRLYKVEAGSDCPPFAGVFKFQAICAGGSIDAARLLNGKGADIAINWAGGMHHARKFEASGFCYFNDVVLGILELLKCHKRVLYIDIDIHHGDGVEEAFYLSHRVMTLSFHKFGDFFPGTGDITDVGCGAGKYYAVNVPLLEGISDRAFASIFQPVVAKCIDVFEPDAIVLQCGADSLTGDRLGDFNLSTRGHGACVEFVRSFHIPLMLVGGGGYTLRNVARAWSYETGIACGQNLDDTLPRTEYFGADAKLHLHASSKYSDRNDPVYLETIKLAVLANISQLEHAPSLQFSHLPAPFLHHDRPWDEEEVDAYQDVIWDYAAPGMPSFVPEEQTTTAGPLITDVSFEGADIGAPGIQVVTPTRESLAALSVKHERMVEATSETFKPSMATSSSGLDSVPTAKRKAKPKVKGQRARPTVSEPISEDIGLSAASPVQRAEESPAKRKRIGSTQAEQMGESAQIGARRMSAPAEIQLPSMAEQLPIAAPSMRRIRPQVQPTGPITSQSIKPTLLPAKAKAPVTRPSTAPVRDLIAAEPVQALPTWNQFVSATGVLPTPTMLNPPNLLSAALAAGLVRPEYLQAALAQQQALQLAGENYLAALPGVGGRAPPLAFASEAAARQSLPAGIVPGLAGISFPPSLLPSSTSIKASLGLNVPNLIGKSAQATRPPHWGSGFMGASSVSPSTTAPPSAKRPAIRPTSPAQPPPPTAQPVLIPPRNSLPARSTEAVVGVTRMPPRPRSPLPRPTTEAIREGEPEVAGQTSQAPGPAIGPAAEQTKPAS